MLAAETGMLEVDAFERLLVSAGLDGSSELPLRVNPFTPEEAARLLILLQNKSLTLGNFPPRMAAAHLLRGVLMGGETTRENLLRRVERFAGVAVLRPDGYLAWVRNGRTQQRVGPLEWKDGAFRAGPFELGRFYEGRTGVFRLLDAQLREATGATLVEVYDDADVVTRSLDGAEEAFVELYHATGQLLTRPMDTLASLRHLPAGMAALIASSPSYWERFRHMTAGEQIKALSRLMTSLYATWGAASGMTRTIAGSLTAVEASVPVLSLSAQGSMVLDRIIVPVGSVATAIGAGTGSVYVLSVASGGEGPKVSGSSDGSGGAREDVSRALGRLWRYPEVLDPRTGRAIPFPDGSLARVPIRQRVSWGTDERAAFIQEWYERGYSTPRGGWEVHDIHHIRPREFGGTNDFWNLVPVERGVHQDLFNAFWRDFVE